MSNKRDVLRAMAKPGTVIIKGGQRGGGKVAAAVEFEVWDEMSVNPPATAKEAEAFCRVQIKRCNMNLANAKDRGDKRAVVHLERKLAVYQFLHRLAKAAPAPTECPQCRVTAFENGVCACCGYPNVTVTTPDQL